MEIIKTPWVDKFFDLVSSSRKSIKMASPFVKNNICNKLIEKKQDATRFELITSYKIFNIYAGSLDLSGLEIILKNNGIVRNYSKLHAKIYLFDDERAIITSGNLTNGGLISNFEYGVYFDDIKSIDQVISDFFMLANDEKTGFIKQNHIDETRRILNEIPKIEKLSIPNQDIENNNADNILEISEKSIIKALSGWKREVFSCIIKINNQTFDLQTIYSFESKLKDVYPNNNHIKDKIRQQLQYLRDIGLVEFLEDGRYKKLWK